MNSLLLDVIWMFDLFQVVLLCKVFFYRYEEYVFLFLF